MAAGPWLRLVASGLRRVHPHRRLLGWGGIAAYTHLSPLIATSQDHTPTSGVVNVRIKAARSAVRVRLMPRLRIGSTARLRRATGAVGFVSRVVDQSIWPHGGVTCGFWPLRPPWRTSAQPGSRVRSPPRRRGGL